MVQHGGATVHAGIPPCCPGCLRYCPGNSLLRHGYMPVAPLLRPGATLHYKTRIKTWSNCHVYRGPSLYVHGNVI